MSRAIISLRLRFVFFCTRSLPGHVAGIVMKLARPLFARLFLIWVFVVAHGILLFAAVALTFVSRKCSATKLVSVVGPFSMRGNVAAQGSFLYIALRESR